jgi:membrane-bound lytic murein transglycosylase MltF
MYLLKDTLQHKEAPVRDYEAIKKEGILRIMTEYIPQGYYVAGDTLQGFQYELCQAVAQISGLEVQIQFDLGLNTAFEALRSNRCDVIAYNIPTYSELKDIYLFTQPIVRSKEVLVQRTSAANNGIEPIREQLKLGGKTLHLPRNSPALLRLRHLEYEMSDHFQIVENEIYSTEQLIILVAKGEIDYAVCDYLIANSLKNEFPEIDIDTDISFTQLQAWAVRKDNPVLLDSLNAWIDRIRENGNFLTIYKRYYTE